MVNVGGDHIIYNHDGLGTAGKSNMHASYIILSTETVPDSNIHQWLASPDVSPNFNAARLKHQPETGSWFIHGELFAKWKQDPKAILGIYGTREYT